MRIGVISDTHGLLRPQALEAMAGSDLILHAGDVGDLGIIERLGTIAPVVAVRGNNDRDARPPKAGGLPARAEVVAAGHRILVLHEIAHLDADPAASGLAAVVYGHSHKPSIERRGGVLYLNPGSAGPRRFRLPVAVALIEATAAGLRASVLELQV